MGRPHLGPLPRETVPPPSRSASSCGCICLVSEFCARGDLFALLADRARTPDAEFNWQRRLSLALDGARGLAFLHGQGVIHRDLKSLNLLLTEDWRLKIADFGLSRFKAASSAAVLTGQCGSFHWMAPEIMNGHAYTEKADVFSFGVIMWELATRKPPYYGIDGQVVSQRVVKEGLRPKISQRDAPGPFLDLMRRCWDDNPDNRPYFGEIMRELEAMNFKDIG